MPTTKTFTLPAGTICKRGGIPATYFPKTKVI
ncbi:hypothetical protein BH10PSE16_BH10PSE16_01150 [soil metagenome]